MFSASYQENDTVQAKVPSPSNESHYVVTRRTSVSAECDALDPPSSQAASGAVSDAAVEALSKMFLFQGLNAETRQQVARFLTPRTAAKGEKIIVQGDEGDYFYIIETGNVHFEVDNKTVGSSGPGTCFGELALLYNAPRAATVIADSECKLWVFSRNTFKSIMVKSRGEKREHSLSVLESIELLNSLDQPAKLRLADALQPQQVSAGEVIIKEGDQGSLFYMIDEGNVQVEIGGEKVSSLGHGDYFGELALLDNSPRAATITAITDVKLETLHREGFERLLGPTIVAELRRRDPRKSS